MKIKIGFFEDRKDFEKPFNEIIRVEYHLNVNKFKVWYYDKKAA
jgi:hypothetical protein